MKTRGRSKRNLNCSAPEMMIASLVSILEQKSRDTRHSGLITKRISWDRTVRLGEEEGSVRREKNESGKAEKKNLLNRASFEHSSSNVGVGKVGVEGGGRGAEGLDDGLGGG